MFNNAFLSLKKVFYENADEFLKLLQPSFWNSCMTAALSWIFRQK